MQGSQLAESGHTQYVAILEGIRPTIYTYMPRENIEGSATTWGITDVFEPFFSFPCLLGPEYKFLDFPSPSSSLDSQARSQFNIRTALSVYNHTVYFASLVLTVWLIYLSSPRGTLGPSQSPPLTATVSRVPTSGFCS